MHIEDVEVQQWLQERMESTQNTCNLSREDQVRILTKLTEAELFEQFIHAKYLGAKRFSLEGAESLIPLLDIAIEDAASRNVQKIHVGMAHRGRLNVLANIMGKQPEQIFVEFEDANPEKYIGKGDVILRRLSSVQTASENADISLCFNPITWPSSHRWFEIAFRRHKTLSVEIATKSWVSSSGDAPLGQGVIQESEYGVRRVPIGWHAALW